MIASHGLSPETLRQIAAVLARFPAVEKAVLFGSRAKGSHKRGSDIDLALSGAGLEWRTVGRIYDSLDDLLLPYRFSLIQLDAHTDEDVAAHVQRVGIHIFARDPAAVSN